MPRSHRGSVDAGTVLREPADVTRAGGDVAHRRSVNARRVRHRTRDRVRRNCRPTCISATDVARRGADTNYAAAGVTHADSRGSHGTRNSMTETLTADRHDNADGIARRAALRAGVLERRDGADTSRRSRGHIWRGRDQRFSVGAALQASRAAFKPDRLGATATDDITAAADTDAAHARSITIGTGVRAVLLAASRARRERSAQRHGDSKS